MIHISLQDVADIDIEKELKTKEGEAPQLAVFTCAEEVTGLYIVCDGVHTMANIKGGIMGAMIKLIAMYYIFDLSYPKPFRMTLAILQVFIMDQPYHEKTNKGYKVLCKNIRMRLAESVQ